MLGYPVLFANWLFGAISGENRWIREQQQRMTEGRPPLADADFAAQLPIHGEQIRICLAVRDAFAFHCGPSRTVASLLLLGQRRPRSRWRSGGRWPESGSVPADRQTRDGFLNVAGPCRVVQCGRGAGQVRLENYTVRRGGIASGTARKVAGSRQSPSTG